MSNSRVFNILYGSLSRVLIAGGSVAIFLKPYLIATGASLSALMLTRTYIYDVNLSTGASMEPTIPNRTNWLGINNTYRKGRGIKIGDCIQVASPQQPNLLAGKRVVGLPGDYVLRSKDRSPTPGCAPMPGVTDWKKRFAIDQLQENEAQVTSLKDDDEWDEPEMIQVPEGHVWVEGDNLAYSRDSRVYGPVPMALIRGRSSWYAEGPFLWSSLRPGKGLRKVEEWEMDAVLGENESDDQSGKKR